MITALKATLNNKYVRIAIIALLSLMAVVSIVQGSRNAIAVSQDFQWDAARALMDGVDPYDISLRGGRGPFEGRLAEFYEVFEIDGIDQKMEANQFPSLLYLLAPYTYLSPLAARYVWLLSNLIFTALIVVLLRLTFLKSLSRFEYICSMLLMLSGTPYRNQLGVGQHTLFSFCFFLLAVYFDEVAAADKSRIRIAVCMFISFFKYTLTAPLTLYLLYRRRIREFAAAVLGHILLTIIAANKLGVSIIYLIKAPLQVSSALSAEGGIDIGALFAGGRLSLIIGGLVAILLCLIAYRLCSNKEYLLFSLLLLWSLIITYHRTYDFFVMSALAGLFVKDYEEDFGRKNYDYTKLYYYIMLLFIYFGLRLFHESSLSMIAVGVIYYAFTIYLTVITVRKYLVRATS